MCFQRRRTETLKETSSNTKFINTQGRLPIDFPVRLLEREMNLEKNFNRPTVEELIYLYSSAIEYYNINEDDQSAANYQVRMQRMLKRPEVLKIFSMPNSQKTVETPEPDQKEPSEFILKSLETPRTILIKQAVEEKKASDKLTGGMLQDSLKSQEIDLETRINQRRRTRTLSNIFTFTENFDSPKLAGSPQLAGSPRLPESQFLSPNTSVLSRKNTVSSTKSEISEDHEKELESAIQELMEKCYEEKSAKIAETTFKYNSEISSVEESGVIGAVLSQLKNSLKEELDFINKDFDEKRRAEVKSLREKWGKFK